MLFLDFLWLFVFVVIVNGRPTIKSMANDFISEHNTEKSNNVVHTKQINGYYFLGKQYEDDPKPKLNQLNNLKHRRKAAYVVSGYKYFDKYPPTKDNRQYQNNIINTYKMGIEKNEGREKFEPSIENDKFSKSFDYINIDNATTIRTFKINKDLFGTDAIEAILNEVKHREIQNIAEHNPSVANLITNTATETIFGSRYFFKRPDFSSNCSKYDDYDLNNKKLMENDISNSEVIRHHIIQRSIIEDSTTIAQNIEMNLQKRLKNVFYKVKNKISQDFNKEVKNTKATVKGKLNKITEKLSNNTKPHGEIHRSTNTSITKQKTTKKLRNSRNTTKNHSAQNQNVHGSTPNHTIPVLGDDVSMLYILEELLTKSHENNFMNVLTTKADSSGRVRRLSRQDVGDNNYKSLNDFDTIDYIDTEIENPSKTVNIITTQNIDSDAATEDTSFEALSNKLSYNEYVNGYKYYLKFQKDQDDHKYSNLVRYQAHRHHKVDDIGKYILNKLPRLVTTKLKRHIVESETLEDQDISTKSEDSWFKKYFFVFLDSEPPKKYHSSQTVTCNAPQKNILSFSRNHTYHKKTTKHSPKYIEHHKMSSIPPNLSKYCRTKDQFYESKATSSSIVNVGEKLYADIGIDDMSNNVVSEKSENELQTSYRHDENNNKILSTDAKLNSKSTAIVKLNKKSKKNHFHKFRIFNDKKQREKRENQQRVQRFNILRGVKNMFKTKPKSREKFFDYQIVTSDNPAYNQQNNKNLLKTEDLMNQVPNISANTVSPYLKYNTLSSEVIKYSTDYFQELPYDAVTKIVSKENKLFWNLSDGNYLLDQQSFVTQPSYPIKYDEILKTESNVNFKSSITQNSMPLSSLFTVVKKGNINDYYFTETTNFDSLKYGNMKTKQDLNTDKNEINNTFLENQLILRKYDDVDDKSKELNYMDYIKTTFKPFYSKNIDHIKLMNSKIYQYNTKSYVRKSSTASNIKYNDLSYQTKQQSKIYVPTNDADIYQMFLSKPTRPIMYKDKLDFELYKNSIAQSAPSHNKMKPGKYNKSHFDSYNIPPKQYFMTPVPMKVDEFDKFLRDNQIDVKYVTAPLRNSVPFNADVADKWNPDKESISEYSNQTMDLTENLKSSKNVKGNLQRNCSIDLNKNDTKKFKELNKVAFKDKKQNRDPFRFTHMNEMSYFNDQIDLNMKTTRDAKIPKIFQISAQNYKYDIIYHGPNRLALKNMDSMDKYYGINNKAAGQKSLRVRANGSKDTETVYKKYGINEARYVNLMSQHYIDPAKLFVNFTENIKINKHNKRETSAYESFTAKNVAALEVVVDLVKGTQTFGEKADNSEDSNHRENIYTPLVKEDLGKKLIQVHIAIPSNLNDTKRCVGSKKIQKIFSAIMSTPVDIEYQIHPLENNTKKTTVSQKNLSPGLYLLVENTSIISPKGNFILKPVKNSLAPFILENKETTKLNTRNNSKINIYNSNEIVSDLVRDKKVVNNLKRNDNKFKRNIVSEIGPNKYSNKNYSFHYSFKRHKKRNIFDSIKKFFGHDRVCNCRCKPNKTMCNACAACDSVITEILFEFDNLAKYMTDHCTEIQTFFWMNPVGGKKMMDVIHHIDRTLNDYYKRVKGKCQGRTCQMMSSSIDKRSFNESEPNHEIVLKIIDLAKIVENIFKLNINNENIYSSGKQCLDILKSCLSKNINKKSLSHKQLEKSFTNNIYSLDNIKINLICKKDNTETTSLYTTKILDEISLDTTFDQYITMYNNFHSTRKPSKKRKFFRNFLKECTYRKNNYPLLHYSSIVDSPQFSSIFHTKRQAHISKQISNIEKLKFTKSIAGNEIYSNNDEKYLAVISTSSGPTIILINDASVINDKEKKGLKRKRRFRMKFNDDIVKVKNKSKDLKDFIDGTGKDHKIENSSKLAKTTNPNKNTYKDYDIIKSLKNEFNNSSHDSSELKGKKGIVNEIADKFSIRVTPDKDVEKSNNDRGIQIYCTKSTKNKKTNKNQKGSTKSQNSNKKNPTLEKTKPTTPKYPFLIPVPSFTNIKSVVKMKR